MRSGKAADAQTVFQICLILLMDVGLGVEFFLPVLHPLERGRQVHVQIEHQIRARQTHLAILEIVQPVKEDRQLRLGQLRALMDGVGGRVAVGEDQAAVFIALAPVGAVGRIADREERGRGISVDVRRVRTERAVEIHPDQCRRFLVVAREHNMMVGHARLVKTRAQATVLRGLSAAVDALQYDQFTLRHGVSSPAACGRWPQTGISAISSCGRCASAL